MKNFALIGTAGYIAPRHMLAIKETGNNLLCTLDPNDSVGVLDAFFPEAAFFTEFERFDRHVAKMTNAQSSSLDYVSICSPNYLHDAHIRWALRAGANVICEKPLGLNPKNVEGLYELQQKSGKDVNTILQLRLHPEVIKLKKELNNNAPQSNTKKNVKLTYITPRGLWYKYSWKGDITKSGGIATNIGIHLFDLLIWLFGKVEASHLHLKEDNKMSGFLELKNANVSWYLSTSPQAPQTSGESSSSPTKSLRSLEIDNQNFDFTTGFTKLHTDSYEQIIMGKGFGIKDALPAIELVHQIRHATVKPGIENLHPLNN